MLNRKMKDMKKGGYTLFSDKTRKMLLAVGLSMLSVGVLATTVNAAPTITADYKKTENQYAVGTANAGQINAGDTDITYQLTLKEATPGLHINKLYYSEDGTTYTEVPAANKLVWQPNADNSEILAVVKMANTVKYFKVDNDKEVEETPAPESSTPLQVAGEGAATIALDNGAPQVAYKYKNEEGNYIQFEAKDNTKIYRVTDEDGKDRVDIEEKDQERVLTAKYELKAAGLENEDKFYIYDILGNFTEVDIGNIDITYTLAAKNTDGTTVVLNMKLPNTYHLENITTVEGHDITTKEGVIKDTRGSSDNLVAVYTKVPEGTTFVNVNYTVTGEENSPVHTLPVLLDLDLKSPVLVQRAIDFDDTDSTNIINEDGNIVKTGGTPRAYKNTAGTKAIVEVCDFGSGITKIVACTGIGADIVESNTSHQTFDVDYLPTSTLQLIDLPEGATYVRIYDGIGNKYDIAIGDIATDDGTNAVELALSGDGNGVIATFRDRQAGIQKLVRATATDAPAKAVDTTQADVSYSPGLNGYESVVRDEDIEDYYPVTEQQAELEVAKLQGVPQMTAVDVLGNTATQNLNDVLFHKDYIYVDVGEAAVNTTQYIAVKVSDARRIKKITATVVEGGEDVEKVLDVFELGQATTEVPELHGPIDLDKVYEIGNGVQVKKVTVYHYNGDVTQNVIELDAADQVKPSEVDDFTTITANSPEAGYYDVAVTYGIRKIEYSDGCEIEFFEDFPKEVNAYTKDKGGDALTSVIITDGLGYTYDLMDETTYPGYEAPEPVGP